MEQGNNTNYLSIFETCPSKVSRIKTQSTMFYVSSTATNKMNTFRTSQFVFTLLMNWITLSSGFASFMPIVLRNTHIFRLFKTYLTD
uniref:Uncharacterized protein n=1 Tax=Meloidogyne incognita TaxID=6306 RepID=A0A914MZT1_MELIC